MNQQQYDNYVKILHSELIPAMGCTEPIAGSIRRGQSPECIRLHA